MISKDETCGQHNLVNCSNAAQQKMADKSYLPGGGLQIRRTFHQSESQILTDGLKDSPQAGYWRKDQQRIPSQKQTLQLEYGEKVSSEQELIETSNTRRRRSFEVGSDFCYIPSTGSSKLRTRSFNNGPSGAPKSQPQTSFKSMTDTSEKFKNRLEEMQASMNARQQPNLAIIQYNAPLAGHSHQHYHKNKVGVERSTSTSHITFKGVSDCCQTDLDTRQGNSIKNLPSQCSAPEFLQNEGNLWEQSLSPQSLAEKQLLGNLDSSYSKNVVRRSTSPRRRSSPLRKFHISRSPLRLPVIIKNLSCSNPKSHDQSSVYEDQPEKTFEDMSVGDSTDSANESEDQVSLSLFKDSHKGSSSAQKKHFDQQHSLRGSAEPVNSLLSKISVLRRWSGANNAGIKNGLSNSDSGSVKDLDLSGKKVQVKNHKKMTEEKGDKVGTSIEPRHASPNPFGIELLNQLRHESSVQLLRDRSASQMRTVTNVNPSDSAPVIKHHPLTTLDYGSDAKVSIEKQKSEAHLGTNVQDVNIFPMEIMGKIGAELRPDFLKHLILGQNNLQRYDLLSIEEATDSPGQDVDWKASVDLQPELQSYKLVSGELKGSEARTEYLSSGLVTGESFIMSERYTGKGSLRRSSNISSDDMLSLLDVADNNKVSQNPAEVVTWKNDSPGDDHKGRFYEQYREKRDAKFRQESVTKRAEREAKLKALQEVLERRRAELASRNVRPLDDKSSLSEQQHCENTYSPKTGPMAVIMQKESDEMPWWEAHKQNQHLRADRNSPITAMAFQYTASTPKSMMLQTSNSRSSVVRKLPSSSQKSLTTSITPRSSAQTMTSFSPKSTPMSSSATTPTGQCRSSNRTDSCVPDKTLYRSVPSYPGARKENTKPSSAKSGPFPQQSKILSSRGTKPYFSNSSSWHNYHTVSPLEPNRVMLANSNLRASVVMGVKKPKTLAVRKSISTVSELKAMQVSMKEEITLSPLKMSVPDLASERSPQSKAYRASVAITSPHEVKPFLRKGHGIGPGSGPGVMKLKASLAAEAAKMNDDDASSKMDAHGSDDPEKPVILISSENVPCTELHAAHIIAGLDTSISSVPNIEGATSAVNSPVKIMPFRASVEPSPQSSDAKGMLQEEINASYSASKNVILFEGQHLPLDSSIASLSILQQEKSLPKQLLQEMKNNSSYVPLGIALPSPRPTLQQHNLTHKDKANLVLAPDVLISHKLPLEYHSHQISGNSSSPLESPASCDFPRLSTNSLPPNIDCAKSDAAQSREMWDNSHKVSVANSQTASKEAPKGFRRLLKFARKSRSSANSNTESISASTTSGEDDVDEATKDVTSKLSEDIMLGTSSKLSNLHKSAESVSKVSEAEFLTGPASRSFFSLSAFRKQKP